VQKQLRHLFDMALEESARKWGPHVLLGFLVGLLVPLAVLPPPLNLLYALALALGMAALLSHGFQKKKRMSLHIFFHPSRGVPGP
jgi:hypothetical protein